LRITGLVRLDLLDNRVNGQEEVFVLDLVEIGFVYIESVEPGPFAQIGLSVTGDPFDIVQKQRRKVFLVHARKVVDIVIGELLMKGVGNMGDTDGEAAAEGFVDREIQIAVCLLEDIHAFQEMVELGVLGEKGGLGSG
jgi:hypothetical protein